MLHLNPSATASASIAVEALFQFKKQVCFGTDFYEFFDL